MVKTVEKTKHTRQASIEHTCQCFGMHREAYYKFIERKIKRDNVENHIFELVKNEWIEQSRVGTKNSINL